MSQVPRLPKRVRLGNVLQLTQYAKRELAFTESELTELWVAVLDWTAGLASPAIEGSRPSTNDAGDPESATERAAFARLDKTDPASVAMHGVIDGLKACVDSVAKVRFHLASLTPLTPEEARRLVEERRPERGLECQNKNCARWVAGGMADRIIAGRCAPCGMHYRRKGEERSKELVEKQVYRETA